MLRFSLLLLALCLLGTGCTVNEVIVAEETELEVARTQVDEAALLDIGIVEFAHGMRDNNDRANAIIFYGALQPGNALFFTISWNGAAPLTLNSGQALLLSS